MSNAHKRQTTLVVLGAGGLGREVRSWARAAGWCVRGFLDDNPSIESKQQLPAPVLGKICDYCPGKDGIFVGAIGTPGTRRAAVESLVSRGGRLATIVHPSAIVAESACIAEGVVIGPFALISENTRIGKGAVIYYHSSVDHDTRIGPWSQISAHCDVTGGAEIGSEVFVGSHASILPGVRVGNHAVIGAGTVVTSDIPAGATAYGVPARIRKSSRG